MSGTITLPGRLEADRALLSTSTDDTVYTAHAARIGLIIEVNGDPVAAARASRPPRTCEPHVVAAAERVFEGIWHSAPRRARAMERGT
ncbi:hypothetical protein [Nocardia bovistercoris]|uniref:Uncharacterized protein n=1 Tax=Nocardia bovistercoris TaxID=2785916 RepID=A0A931IFI9_9NOCA|nr:hypothetical protein [Nocardia bovistercoris]MBH0778758.1 hypothetical protein [Nocardia bovistercoris]